MEINSSNSKLIFIAHRGESYEAPENTIASINLAWNQNADGVEIDVRLTKDNEIVAIHDINTKRISGVSKAIKSNSLEELKKLDAGIYKGEKWANEKIPALQEILNTVPANKQVFIEIKCGVEILPKLKEVLASSSVPNSQIKLIGFDLSVMSSLKKSMPDYDIYWSKRIDRRNIILTRSGWNKIISTVRQNNFDGLNLSYSRCLNKSVVEKIKSNGLKLFIWIVNDPKTAYKLLKLGVDGIISDRTGWLRKKNK